MIDLNAFKIKYYTVVIRFAVGLLFLSKVIFASGDASASVSGSFPLFYFGFVALYTKFCRTDTNLYLWCGEIGIHFFSLTFFRFRYLYLFVSVWMCLVWFAVRIQIKWKNFMVQHFLRLPRARTSAQTRERREKNSRKKREKRNA